MIQLLIDSVDQAALLTGELKINMAEGAARVATFTLDPLPGNIDANAWTGKPVVVVNDSPSGLLFTGKVHAPEYDIDTGLLKITCSDLLQEEFETVPRAAADAKIPVGYWDQRIFRSTRDNWDYAQQKLSTYAGSLDKAPDGTLRATPWAAKTTPDLTYTAANIDAGTLKISKLAERRSLINKVKITYSSVFQALRQREQYLSWQAVYDTGSQWIDYLRNAFALPEKQAVEAALKDWILKEINYVELPATGVYTYNDGELHQFVWTLNDYARAQCQGFTATVCARWRQDLAIEYEITVQSAASIAQYGELPIEQNYQVSYKKKGRDEDFLVFDTYRAAEGPQIHSSISNSEWLNSTQGDDSLPQLIALLIAKNKILDSHRQNRVKFRCAINPAIDTDLTIAISHPNLTTKGKVTAVEHSINLLTGLAVTECEIAITQPSAAGQTDNSITRSLTPYTVSPPDLTPPGDPPDWEPLTQHLGYAEGAPPDDPDWLGLVSNYTTYIGTGTPPVYDIRFAVKSPALDSTNINAWLNTNDELQVNLYKVGANYWHRASLSGQIAGLGDSVQFFDDAAPLGAAIILNATDLSNGYVQIAATNPRQDEKSITYIVESTFDIALPVESLVINK